MTPFEAMFGRPSNIGHSMQKLYDPVEMRAKYQKLAEYKHAANRRRIESQGGSAN
jgi:hypothetical protein